MGTFYFALASTTVPDDTVYEAQENIICAVNGNTPNISVTIGASIGGDLVSAGASVNFQLSSPNFDGSSLCMFTEGTRDGYENVTDPITLKQARDLLYDMLTAPNVDCKTCGRIPIGYPNNTNGTANGILKIDVRDANNCLGKCVGPNSFNVQTATAKSVAGRVKPFKVPFGLEMLTTVFISWLLGVAVVGLRLL